MNREFDEGPFHVVVNATPEYRPGAPANVIDGYRVQSITTRRDGAAVVGNFLQHLIPQGGLFMTVEQALDHGSRLARDAIAAGFQ
ncbi:hypothetical protein [Burkholderia cepacia]|uniref:hypothetical protein n=1 Tax=Burkholderia cepacia TaxID=292 RepID=UPI002FDFE0BC